MEYGEIFTLSIFRKNCLVVGLSLGVYIPRHNLIEQLQPCPSRLKTKLII